METRSVYQWIFFLKFLSIPTPGYGGGYVLIPETTRVIENSTLRLHCIYKADTAVIPENCRWNTIKSGDDVPIAIMNDKCSVANFIPAIYTFECENATYNTMSIISTGRIFHNKIFNCSFSVNGIYTAGNSTVHVIVPVSSIRLIEPTTDFVITTENSTVTFVCITSGAHPRPNITWYSDSQTRFDYRDDVAIMKNIIMRSDDDGYLYTVMNILTFYPTKYDNGSSIYCNASNIEQHSISSTRKALLYVQYPPSTPMFFMRTNVFLNEVAIIINNSLTIRCKSSGNPFPSYKWTTPQNKEVSGEDLSIENIKQTDDGTYSCIAYNALTTAGEKENYNNSASFEVTVLIPPDSPKLYYISHGMTKQIGNSTINVVSGDDVRVLCNSTGKPHPVSVWNGPEPSDILSINSIRADVNNTCTSLNRMTETAGETQNGSVSRELKIIVSYPPRNPVIQIEMKPDSRQEALNSTGILEGSDLSLYCEAVSNPSPTYKWTGPVSSNYMNISAELFVRNIQRNQSGPYICEAQNKMERSFGNMETGRNNRSIYFDILYKADIKYFGAANLTNSKNMMTTNQSEETQIICKLESNPYSNNTIFFKGRLVNETIRSDTVTYNLIDPKCSNAGRYICKGKNVYNHGADASKELYLYVKCLPQPSASQPPEKNVSAALSDSAVFRFHAAPYYDPGITEFRWFKQEDDRRIMLQNDTKTYISSSDIHSVLRIIDVSLADYGVYILEYNNSVGMNDFTFYLQQRDQTEEIQQGNGKNYLPIVIGIFTAVLVILGITLGMVIYIRRYKQKTDSNNTDRSYDNICGVNTKSGGNNSINCVPVYEGLKPIDERGYMEIKERTYDILQPKDSHETKDPVYTNLKL